MDKIVAEATAISEKTADQRTATYAHQLQARYNNLLTSLQVSSS